MVYETDPAAAPDSDFAPGRLEHLVPGNAGRLLDARRTPIAVTAVSAARGEFEVEIGAFEDAGARWGLPLQEVRRFQFDRNARTAPAATVAELRRAIDRFDVAYEIAADRRALAATRRRIAAVRGELRAWLRARRQDMPLAELDACVVRRAGDDRLTALLAAFLHERDLAPIDEALAQRLVSNPRSGELVKGHAIVLAELGLAPYEGTIVRDPALFDGPWSKARRAEHVVARLAFVQEMWARHGRDHVTLFRAAASDGSLAPRRTTSLVSATFSRDVAEAHFAGGPATRTAALWRQEVPVDRLFMTFLETAAMNAQFAEAEAVILGDGASWLV